MQRRSVAHALRSTRTIQAALVYRLPAWTTGASQRTVPFSTTPTLRLNLSPRALDPTEAAPVAADEPEAFEPTEEALELEDEGGEGGGEALWADEGPSEEIPPSTFQLRPYQVDCIEACLKALREGGVSRIGVSSPTGSGKTSMFTSLIRRLPPLIHPHHSTLATRVLVIVGSVELARQARDTIERTWPDLTVEIEQGSKNIASGKADVTIATYQTLSTRGMSRLDKFDPETFKAVIVDEAHHAVAKSYLAILARFDSRILTSKPSLDLAESIAASPILAVGTAHDSGAVHDPALACDPVHPILDEAGKICVPIIGFTATFGRADGLALGKIFELIAWHGDWLDMIRGRWLSPLSFVTVQLGPELLDLSAVEVSSQTGEFVQTSLARAVGKREVVSASVEAWLAKARDRRSTLVFAINVEHVLSLTNAFRAAGIDARFVYEGTPPKERVATLAGFRALEFPVLVNCGILTEGADFPGIDTVLLARPTRSQNLYLQMIGRGLRNSPETGKTECLVMDMVGNSSTGIICAPRLFGIDPDALQDGEARSTDELEVLAVSAPLAPDPIVVNDLDLRYKHFATVFDLTRSTASTPDQPPMSRVSGNAWVGCGSGTYVLELMGAGSVKIVKVPAEDDEPASYVASRYARFGMITTKHFLARDGDLPSLIRTVDAALANKATTAALDVRRHAPWRKSPSSEVQQALIGKKLAPSKDEVATSIDAIWVGRTPGSEIELKGLTKGQASDIICRLKNGGLGHWRKVQKARQKDDKKRAKQRQKDGLE